MSENKQEQLDDIAAIKNMMEESSRFLSLSGLSGVFAGLYALIGAGLVYVDFSFVSSGKGTYSYFDFIHDESGAEVFKNKLIYLFTVAIIVLVLSLITGYFFSNRKVKNRGGRLFDSTAKRMLLNLFIPLLAGGFFCLALIKHNSIGLVPPATLVFYGIALYNAGKYSYKEIRILGILEIVLGVISGYFMGFGLLFWALGFGLLHIIYGVFMYMKYERK